MFLLSPALWQRPQAGGSKIHCILGPYPRESPIPSLILEPYPRESSIPSLILVPYPRESPIPSLILVPYSRESPIPSLCKAVEQKIITLKKQRFL